MLDCFQNFHVAVEREIWLSFKLVRSDNGGEYIGPFEKVQSMLSHAKLLKIF